MNNTTIVGNISKAPELRFTPSGAPVVNFNVAETPRRYDATQQKYVDSGPTNYWRCTAWNQRAENIANSLNVGDQVLMTGKLKTEEYINKEGIKVTSTNNFDVEEIGKSLAFDTVVSTKNVRSTGGYNGGQAQGGGQGGYNGGNQNNGGYGGGQGGYNAPAQNSGGYAGGGQGGFGNSTGGTDAPPF